MLAPDVDPVKVAVAPLEIENGAEMLPLVQLAESRVMLEPKLLTIWNCTLAA
ncbi:hypothetical protein [Azospirillum argentinense]